MSGPLSLVGQYSFHSDGHWSAIYFLMSWMSCLLTLTFSFNYIFNLLMNYLWNHECFVEDLFLGGQWSIILGYRRLSVKSLQVLLLLLQVAELFIEILISHLLL